MLDISDRKDSNRQRIMNASTFKRRTAKIKTRSRFSVVLALYLCTALIIPNCILAYTEHYSLWITEASILLPLGFYMMWSVALRRSGIQIWLAFPFIFIACFQIVLLYLFGNSVIATDMFTNLLTTNPGEAGELLSNIYPSVILVGLLYIPLLWLAAREIAHRRYLTRMARIIIGMTGAALFSTGLLLLWPAYRMSEDRHVLRDQIFPINAFYNMGVCASEFRKVSHFNETSDGFSFEAIRTDSVAGREIYVYIIGEASRAMNWQLYGYERETTPELIRTDSLVVFRNILTQSNTTHKSVPMFLSSIATDQHDELYRRKGLPALFNEVGFDTWFISNQSPQGAMIDRLVHDTKHIVYLESPRHDMQLLETMQRCIAESRSRKIFFMLHCYGSHFSYHQRYPRKFARFLPDDDVAISAAHVEKLRNAYDNSIRYTDHFLAKTIDYLNSLDRTTSALLYCADHGEDLFDDTRGRFLHASPTTTAYQLYVASLAWFSPKYRRTFPQKVAAAKANAHGASTTHMMFHTIADIASIESDYLDRSVSLVSSEFDHSAPRYYLNYHNEAVPFRKTGLCEYDEAVFRKFRIEL